VSRRARALAFLLAAAMAALAAAAIADGYGKRVALGYGELRAVVVVREKLEAGTAIDPRRAVSALELRRIPRRFVPPGALGDPAAAIGLAPVTAIPAGSYLLAPQLRPPRAEGTTPGLGRGRGPVQIAVGGAEALLLAGADPVGSRVDVVVTAEPVGAGPGRTYVAAAGVPLLGLGRGGVAAEGIVSATLGLTRRQALRLIAAESFARRLTLLASR
jgi:hypothetical protein